MVASLGDGYQFKGVATPATNPGTPDQNVFYIASEVGTYSNFGLSVGENEVAVFLWNGSWSKQSTGAASAEAVNQLGQQVIYDVTKNNPTAGPNNDGKFESLSALLSDANLSTLIPIAVRCGGMSIRFVQSSDNKYVQYRLMSDIFSISPFDWQKEDLTPIERDASLLYTEQNVLSIFDMKLLTGELTSTQIVANNERILVLRVNGGDVIRGIRNDTVMSIFSILSEFDFNYNYPYNLVYATGESQRDFYTANYEYKITLPQDAKYIVFRAVHSNGTNSLPKSLKINDYDLTKSLRDNIDVEISDIKDSLEIDINESNNIKSDAGYYDVRADKYKFTKVDGFKASNPIAVRVGDVIVTNTNYDTSPYSYGGNCIMDSSMTIFGQLPMVNGVSTITQELWDSGARYIGISFRDSEMTESPKIHIYRSRILSLEQKAEELQGEIDEINLKNKILVVKDNQYNFNIYIYDNSGRKTKYKFIRYYHTADIEYIDGDGNTQTATDVVTANTWTNSDIYNNEDKYIIQGNTNFIFVEAPNGGARSDMHGLEVDAYIQFLVDGKEWDPVNGNDNLVCESFRMIKRSFVYQHNGGGQYYYNAIPAMDTDGLPIKKYIHNLNAEFKVGNTVDIYNRLTCLQDNIVFKDANAAMLECYFTQDSSRVTFDTIQVNNPECTINHVDSSGIFTKIGGSELLLSQNQDNTKVDVPGNIAEMYGNDFYVRQEIESIEYPDECVLYIFRYSDRVKCYFQPLRVTGHPDGTTGRTLNTGDTITVRCFREIRLS